MTEDDGYPLYPFAVDHRERMRPITVYARDADAAIGAARAKEGNLVSKTSFAERVKGVRRLYEQANSSTLGVADNRPVQGNPNHSGYGVQRQRSH